MRRARPAGLPRTAGARSCRAAGFARQRRPDPAARHCSYVQDRGLRWSGSLHNSADAANGGAVRSIACSVRTLTEKLVYSVVIDGGVKPGEGEKSRRRQ